MTAPAGQTVGNLNFGEFQTITVSGEVYDDVTGTGALEPNDPVLPGWRVDLINAGGQVVKTAATDSNGDFSFSGVGPGTFTVEEVVQSGYDETTSPSTYSLTPTGGQNVTGLGFGNFQQWSVSGTLYQDTNQDGKLDDGETGLSGWTVNVLNGSNKVVASATTDSHGNYALDDLPPGAYTIRKPSSPATLRRSPAQAASLSRQPVAPRSVAMTSASSRLCHWL